MIKRYRGCSCQESLWFDAAFEVASKMLCRKGLEVKSVGTLKINLAAIQKNWQQFEQMTSTETRVAAVVKADAYGLGAKQVVAALFAEGCEHFFVATLAEAIEVKDIVSGIVAEISRQKMPMIYILSGINPGEFEQCADEDFIPVLYSVDHIKSWADFCIEKSISPSSVIKVDTGMHRLGISEPELVKLMQEKTLLQACHPVLLMSHLACADDKDAVLNGQQLSVFERCATAFKALFPSSKLSLSNSAGVFLGREYHFDIVRAGIGLYGGSPTPYTQNPMHPVVDLALPIAQIKEIEGPATVGYGATFTIPANKKMKLAITLGGYGDGIFRCLSNTGSGFVAGVRVPVVGRVSMDSVIFDVSGVDDTLLENQFVSLIGSEKDSENLVDRLADEAGTISYEILTSLGDRYDRIYY